jgi:hypothetical protein
VVFGLLAVSVYWQYQRGVFGGGEDAPDIRTVGKAADPAGLTPVVEVPIETPPAVEIPKHSRNLFNYSKSPTEVADEIRARKEAERLAAEAAERQRRQAEEAARIAAEQAKQIAANPPPPPPPVINFRFIGKMGDARNPIAILADGAGDLLTVREGEIIKDTFKVRKIDFDSVVIGYVKPEWTDTRIIKMGS